MCESGRWKYVYSNSITGLFEIPLNSNNVLLSPMCWYILQNISIETCSDLNCGDHGNCIKHETILVCKCKSGFTGQVCETTIGECESSPCKNNGVCKDQPDKYECLCQAGYTGTLCEVGKCINEICLGIILIIFDTLLDLQHLGYFVV